MKKLKKLFFAAGMVMMAAGLFAGCGKSKKSSKEDKVIHISTAPEPTVTPNPRETDPDAVTVNGNLTMVNEYLMENPGTAPESVTVAPEASGDGTSDSSSGEGDGSDAYVSDDYSLADQEDGQDEE